MSESDVTAPKPSGDRRVEVGGGQPPFHDRRKAPRPPLAEIRRGGTLNLLPPVVVSGAVRTAEFLLISLLGLGIYLGYVDYENDRVHLFYLCALFVAAFGYMSIAHMLGLYQVSSFNRFVLGFTRVFIAWTIVIAGLMSIAFFVKISADFSRVWIATWYASGLGVLFVERLFLSFLARKWLKEGRLYRRFDRVFQPGAVVSKCPDRVRPGPRHVQRPQRARRLSGACGALRIERDVERPRRAGASLERRIDGAAPRDTAQLLARAPGSTSRSACWHLGSLRSSCPNPTGSV
jgi:hypothetical protein